MKSLLFKILTNQDEAKEVWNILSLHKTIDDEWDFRYSWIKELNYPLKFIVGYDQNNPVGLLALQLNNNTGISQKLLNATIPFLEFFGGVDTDDNKVILKPKYQGLEKEFLTQVKNYAILTDLKDPYETKNDGSTFYINRYELDLVKINSFQTFLNSNFDGKSRQRLINRLNKINKTYKVGVKDAKNNLQLLFDLNIQRFGDNSSFNMDYRKNVYKNLMDYFDVDVFSINLDGKPEAISYGIIFNKIYTTINIGYNTQIRDLQKLLVTTQIKRAQDKGCKVLDAGQGDNGWKEHFHLRKIPQYRLDLNNKPKNTN